MKRIKAGDVYNDYTLYVNGNRVKSNRVVTHTPEDPKPQKSSTPVPQPPVQGASVATLPETGEVESFGIVALGGILTLFGLVGASKSTKRKH